MQTEPMQDEGAAQMPELKKTNPPEERERLSELLDQAKRMIASGLSEPKTSSETEPPVTDDTGKSCALTASEDVDAVRDLDVVRKLRALVASRVEDKKRPRFPLPQPTGLASLWVISGICVAVLAITLGGTGLVVNQPKKAEATAPLPQKPATESSAKAPIQSPALAGTSAEPGNASQPLSAGQVKLLVARGDALLSIADVGSARLLYERAVAAGDAQAALRLGATYDPLFLSQADLTLIRADPALAAYWYERGRDLGAVGEAEALLKGIDWR